MYVLLAEELWITGDVLHMPTAYMPSGKGAVGVVTPTPVVLPPGTRLHLVVRPADCDACEMETADVEEAMRFWRKYRRRPPARHTHFIL